ncbi:hypothetical protein HERIO_1803 [Hepatospora eriocheir]|uniref:Uncharacterized protein n=1 Tax=Hepatospora eriocheir TaxID=1081669 RepID=A0A1X0Q919_9MICR|nr:hypothetical protein HERIO_1803 [Hepatospora eriocheir]
MRIRCVNLSQTLINYCENKGGCMFSYTEEVKVVFVEVLLGSIFSKIIKIKIENNDIEKYIFEMCEIENYLSKKMRKIPAISLIKSYLKIISCPPEDPEVFVQNFLLHSGNNFNFNQIIGKFDDKTKTNILKEEYSKLIIKK